MRLDRTASDALLGHAEIRPTHLTGVTTDIGIDMGKLFDWNRHTLAEQHDRLANCDRLRVLASLCLSFFLGGVSGALRFKPVGDSVTIPLALVLLAGVPAMDDLRGDVAKRFRAREARIRAADGKPAGAGPHAEASAPATVCAALRR